MAKKDEIKDAVKKCKDKTKDLKKEVKSDKDKIAELTSLLKSVQADFENYKKRTEQEKQDSNYYFKKEIITKLLPVLDMFELALKHTENKEEFIKGMEMIFAQFLATLENEGLQPIKEKEFNPTLHEAVIAEESDEKENTILEELQKGYTINGKVIRCSRVKVSKNV